MRIVKYFVWVVFGISLLLFGAAAIRDLSNWDSSRPVLQSEQEEIEVPCAYTEEEILQGLTASDEKDGDLTSRILPGSMTRFIEPGVCDMTYVVFDSSNQSASLTRRVRFADYESPRFQASAPLVFSVNEGDYQQLIGRISVSDMLDGDIKDGVVTVKSSVLYSKEGAYSISLEASNSFGDTASLELPVHIVSRESLALPIRLTGYIVYLRQGEAFDPRQLISEEQSEGLTKDQVQVAGSTVDTGTPGVYEVQYNVYNGQQSGVTWAAVVVR